MKKVNKIVYAGLFSALAFIIGLWQIPTPFQEYLRIDGSEIVVLVAGNFFGFGVMSTVIIFRSVLRFVFGFSSGIAFIGELAAILSSFIFGGFFLLIKRFTKNKQNTYKINLLIMTILSVLLVPFTIFAVKAINDPGVNNSNWLVLGLLTVFTPIVLFLIMNIIKIDFCKKHSTAILESTTAIMLNTIIMTFLNFLVITPSNAMQKPATFLNVINDLNFPMNLYIFTFILPLIPFNILKGIISVIVYFMLEKSISIVVSRNK